MKKYLLILILLLTCLVSLSSCSAGAKEVKVYEMASFSETKEESLMTITDKKQLKQLQKAFGSAKKQPGIANMADPQYKVEIGKETYFLWLDQDHGTIMDVKDTHTIYTLSEKSVKHIHAIIQ